MKIEKLSGIVSSGNKNLYFIFTTCQVVFEFNLHQGEFTGIPKSYKHKAYVCVAVYVAHVCTWK